jgi:hypothetical protein
MVDDPFPGPTPIPRRGARLTALPRGPVPSPAVRVLPPPPAPPPTPDPRANPIEGKVDWLIKALESSLHEQNQLGASVVGLKDDQTKQRTDLMGRLDRLQDEQTKQRTEMEVVIELLRDTAPAQLLMLIRQMQDEIRELKGDRP